MKTIIVKRILSIFTAMLLFVTFVLAQENSIVGKFIVSENKGVVYLEWAIIAGSTCNGIQIYRSTDSINFTQIGSIPGICGSTTFSQPYNFTDDNPVKNKVNYYRLQLGGQGTSPTVSIEIIDVESNGYQIRPNPSTTEAKIYFDNNPHREYQLTIYNLSGIILFTTSTREDFFQLNTGFIESGIHLFTISTNGNLPTTQGKFLVQH